MKTIIILIYFIPVFYFIVRFGPNIIKEKFRGPMTIEGLTKIIASFVWPVWFFVAFCCNTYDIKQKTFNVLLYLWRAETITNKRK